MSVRFLTLFVFSMFASSTNAFIGEGINGFEKDTWYKSDALYSSPFVSDGSTAYRGVMYVNRANKLSFAFEAYGLFTSVDNCKGKDKIYPNWIPEKVNGINVKMSVACVYGGTTYRYLPLSFKGQKYVLEQFLANKSVTFGHVSVSSIGFNKQFKDISELVLSYNEAL